MLFNVKLSCFENSYLDFYYQQYLSPPPFFSFFLHKTELTSIGRCIIFQMNTKIVHVIILKTNIRNAKWQQKKQFTNPLEMKSNTNTFYCTSTYSLAIDRYHYLNKTSCDALLPVAHILHTHKAPGRYLLSSKKKKSFI